MPIETRSKMDRRALLEAARAGDEDAFARLIEPHRDELRAHCYRMLGSRHDAEDALQETLIRAWRGLAGFVDRGSLRSWLYAIATNASLRLIERRPRRVLPVEFGPGGDADERGGLPLLESVWMEPYPGTDPALEETDAVPDSRYDRRESMELAFIAALQHLPPNQRAVLLLREVLGFSANEVAASLGTTTASVNSALQRARRTVDQRVPEPSQQVTLRALGDRRLRRLVSEYVEAMEQGDVARVVELLSEDATWSMLAAAADRSHGPRTWYRGRRAVAEFLANGPLSGRWRWRHLLSWANEQPAVCGYTWDAGTGRYELRALDVLSFDGERIAAVTAFLDRPVLRRLGLPPELPD
jgi:RNA polymerase sigma-70 factor, ECF subfamily